MTRTVFDLPVVPCGDARDHDWHSNGTVFCPGTPAVVDPDEVTC